MRAGAGRLAPTDRPPNASQLRNECAKLRHKDDDFHKPLFAETDTMLEVDPRRHLLQSNRSLRTKKLPASEQEIQSLRLPRVAV